ncbi:hypothetical protein B0T13DRAFT_449227 [Neurospora crassa]|nr:hypothetical protein B0T13DRAFT_449227 [Neurospora crassa]
MEPLGKEHYEFLVPTTNQNEGVSSQATNTVHRLRPVRDSETWGFDALCASSVSSLSFEWPISDCGTSGSGGSPLPRLLLQHHATPLQGAVHLQLEDEGFEGLHCDKRQRPPLWCRSDQLWTGQWQCLCSDRSSLKRSPRPRIILPVRSPLSYLSHRRRIVSIASCLSPLATTIDYGVEVVKSETNSTDLDCALYPLLLATAATLIFRLAMSAWDCHDALSVGPCIELCAYQKPCAMHPIVQKSPKRKRAGKYRKDFTFRDSSRNSIRPVFIVAVLRFLHIELLPFEGAKKIPDF